VTTLMEPLFTKQNGVYTMDTVDEEDIDIKLEKPSRATRWKRSLAARLRRQVSKFAKTAHLQKDEEDALARIRAKKLLEKQKKQKRNKVVDNRMESV
jgi:hypothetical protein